MTTTAWRFVKAKYQDKAFEGEGARIHPGRWNTATAPIVYAAGAISLGILELLTYINDTSLLPSYLLFRADISNRLIVTLQDADLPADWRTVPAPASTKMIGDAWFLHSRSAVLCIPSAVIPLERNYLINPAHPQFGEIKVSGPVDSGFDPRILKFVRQ
jgi:RES domain-containing protein